MDFDLENNVIYYGDRNSSYIWRVSIDRVSSLQDDRTLIATNATVWSMSYDWINGYLYWTDDMYVIANFKQTQTMNRIPHGKCNCGQVCLIDVNCFSVHNNFWK